MQGFKLTYCSNCRAITAHDLYTSDSYIHSLCTDCGKDVSSSSRIDKQNGEATKICGFCDTTTEHIRYTSDGYIHWFCCSCGKDISSSSRQ